MARPLLALLILLSACANRPADSNPLAADTPKAIQEITLPPPPPDARDQLTKKDDSYQVGYERKLEYGVTEAGSSVAPPQPGTWTDSESGPLWTAQVRSETAAALRVHIEPDPEATGQIQAWEYQAGQKNRQVLDQSAPFPADLWTQTAEGDTILIEYRPPEGTPTDTPVPFRLDRLSHIWTLP